MSSLFKLSRRCFARVSDKMDKWRLSYPPPLEVSKRGGDIINDPLYNKGTNFGYHERDRMNIRGLVPPRILSIEDQEAKVKKACQQEEDPLRQNLYLQALQNRNETLFFKVLMNNIEEFAPIVYTPTVGLVCQRFGVSFRRTRGMYFSSQDRSVMGAMAYNWPVDDVKVIVITDGSRILGLGDLGTNGMGIPIGKLALYTAVGGIHPRQVLPVMFDAGTNNKELLSDNHYLGMRHERLVGDEYFSLLDEMICALKSRWPNCLIQFEDFQTNVASTILDTYRRQHLCFNDDIQGTGSVTLAGVLSALRILGKSAPAIKDQRIVIAGAGSAGIGVATTLLSAMVANGMRHEDAKKRFWICDQNGLLNETRESLMEEQVTFARSWRDKAYPDKLPILDVIKQVKPTILLGLTAFQGAFSQEMVEEMAKHVERPILFPLSNPLSKAECSAEDAYKWTKGQCIFASGSPFKPVNMDGKMFYPSQCNNMYIFPGVGLGAVLCRASQVTDGMFYAASEMLSTCLDEADAAKGLVFPSISKIRDVTARVAAAVIRKAVEEGVAQSKTLVKLAEGEDLLYYVQQRMYQPIYQQLVYRDDPQATQTWHN